MYGAVDVGTNTVRLLIGQVQAGWVEPQRYFRRITRLGGGFTSQQGLAPAAMERTLDALREIAGLLHASGIRQVRAAGTAVLREAGNGADFIRRVSDQTGIPLQIIDGEEEARLTALGVCSALDPRPQTALMVDLGGGSTEFVLWHQGRARLHRSYPLGVVRLAEDTPDPADQQKRIASVLDSLRQTLEEEGWWSLATAPACRLVGTAGTVTTLAALHLQMAEYDWRRINNQVLERQTLQGLLHRLLPMPVRERELLPGMEPGRGDLIVPGLRVFLALFEFLGHKSLTVSDFGLLEGILLDLDNTCKH